VQQDELVGQDMEVKQQVQVEHPYDEHYIRPYIQ
jgi:hypothetical protein